MGFRLRLLAIIATGALLLYGFVDMWEGIKFMHKQVLTYDQFVRKSPQEGWFRITGGRMDLSHTLYMRNKETKVRKALYVPLFSPTTEEKACYVMVKTNSPEVEAALDALPTSESTPENLTPTQVAAMFPAHDFEGMLVTGLHGDSEIRDQIMQHSDVSSNYVILEEGRQPTFLKGLGMLAAGILFAVCQIVYYRNNYYSA